MAHFVCTEARLLRTGCAGKKLNRKFSLLLRQYTLHGVLLFDIIINGLGQAIKQEIGNVGYIFFMAQQFQPTDRKRHDCQKGCQPGGSSSTP
jgi:hypothetical protein